MATIKDIARLAGVSTATVSMVLNGKDCITKKTKEKVMAAQRMGIHTVLLPAENERDLKQLPEDVRAKLDVKMIGRVDQAIHYVLKD